MATDGKSDFRAQLQASRNARFRDRGGMFKPKDDDFNPILDALMKRKADGKTPSPKKKVGRASRGKSAEGSESGASNRSNSKPRSKSASKTKPRSTASKTTSKARSTSRGRSKSRSVASEAEVEAELTPPTVTAAKATSDSASKSRSRSKRRASSVGCASSSPIANVKSRKRSRDGKDDNDDEATPPKRARTAPLSTASGRSKPASASGSKVKPRPKSKAPLSKSTTYGHGVPLSIIDEAEENESRGKGDEENALVKFMRRLSQGGSGTSGSRDEMTAADTSRRDTSMGTLLVEDDVFSAPPQRKEVKEVASKPPSSRVSGTKTATSNKRSRIERVETSEAEDQDIERPAVKHTPSKPSPKKPPSKRVIVPFSDSDDDIPLVPKKVAPKKLTKKKSRDADESSDEEHRPSKKAKPSKTSTKKKQPLVAAIEDSDSDDYTVMKSKPKAKVAKEAQEPAAEAAPKEKKTSSKAATSKTKPAKGVKIPVYIEETEKTAEAAKNQAPPDDTVLQPKRPQRKAKRETAQVDDDSASDLELVPEKEPTSRATTAKTRPKASGPKATASKPKARVQDVNSESGDEVVKSSKPVKPASKAKGNGKVKPVSTKKSTVAKKENRGANTRVIKTAKEAKVKSREVLKETANKQKNISSKVKDVGKKQVKEAWKVAGNSEDELDFLG